MLNKTRMEALQILEEEIDLAYKMFLETAKKKSKKGQERSQLQSSPAPT